MGARMVKEVAIKTSDVAGDGTTTATVLAEAIFNEGLQGRRRRRQPDAHEARHGEGRRGHRREAQEDEDPRQGQEGPGERRHRRRQQRHARSARSSPRRWTRSARTASSPSRKARRIETGHEFVEGMQFDRGYLSPYFVTDRRRWSASSKTRTSSSTKRRSPATRTWSRCWRRSSNQGKPILIIAEEVEGEALATLVINRPARRLQGVRRSRPPATAIAARPCSKTSPS